MIADALTRMPFMRPEDALAASLDKARKRLPVGQPAEHIDGRHGIVRAVWAKDLDVLVLIELPDGKKVPDFAGHWTGRQTL